MSDSVAKSAIAQYDQLKLERSSFEALWQDISDNVVGRRDTTTMRTPGQRRMAPIHDITALLSGELLAGALHSLMTNSASKWFRLGIRNRALMEDPDVKFWLDEIAEPAMYDAFNRPEAGFNPQIHEVYFDLTVFCTAAMTIEDYGQGAVFSARPLREAYIAEDVAGRVDTIFRDVRMSARNAADLFGDNAPKAAKLAMSKDKPEEKIEVLQAIRPNRKVVSGRLDFTGMPWSSLYIDTKDKTVISEGGYRELPMMVPRWSKDSGERYGRGPGVTALSDAKMLNTMWKTIIKGAQKMVDPPLLMDNDGVISPLRTAPGSVNIQESTSLREESVRPLLTGGRPDLGIDLINRKQENIKSAFHSEVLPLFNSPYMTATQVLQLIQQAQRFLSPIMGRLQSELLEPMVERVFALELRAGRLGPVPPILAGQNISVEYISPIARAQKAVDVEAIVETFSIAAQLEQVTPGVIDNLDSDVAIRKIAEAKGVPVQVLVDPQTVVRVREAKQALAAQQQKQEQMLQEADMAAKVIPALAAAGDQEALAA